MSTAAGHFGYRRANAGFINEATAKPDYHGIHVVEQLAHVDDFLATNMHLIGLDHEKLNLPPRGAGFIG